MQPQPEMSLCHCGASVCVCVRYVRAYMCVFWLITGVSQLYFSANALRCDFAFHSTVYLSFFSPCNLLTGSLQVCACVCVCVRATRERYMMYPVTVLNILIHMAANLQKKIGTHTLNMESGDF